jgi:hypothetical protein
LKANTPLNFKFSVQDKDGKPAMDLEPYMGMAGHAEFVSKDMSIFAHVHPAGSVSMAAMELARTARTGPAGELQVGGMAMGMPIAVLMPGSSVPAEVSFPYGFPRAGDYRIFVQIKRGGVIETGVFDARVE